ncbi:MAG: hypothetical protein KKE42_05965 [Alphaproteobacteria bacterium]|uniref:hypothetical protein n=1 Tax=Brevundimonas sp. TaxID=1871086 RepID=UPI001856DCCE|nr:hypothetical protein [Brevundimonas sp.]MBA3050244.1 hypothetical protein [Brevundimonas sp.]MBU3973329.1 hypothetical protein [Alphaproteobacteria bacterium]MBU4136627.1 hypothetical protein [Alphaproteobacteria bacterium]
MDTMPLTAARRLEGARAYGRPADAFETIAWRPPSAARFDPRAANDPAVEEPTMTALIADLPGWVGVVAGGVIAALMGALLGGALAL